MSFIDWRDVFDELFEDYPHNWKLTSVHRNDTSQHQNLEKCRKMERIGYARFHCSKCSNNWASAKAMVVFYYPGSNQPLGKVSMRLYGQQCKKCSGKKTFFADPEFENDRITTYLTKLHERIGQNCYGEEKPPQTESNNSEEKRMNGPHEKKLCEACQSGRCDQVKRIS